MAGLGLLGLQWSGVTTTLRCLCGTSVAADAGQGIADVHDPRLGELARVSRSKRMVPATLEVSDLTRLVRGARRGEELGGELAAGLEQGRPARSLGLVLPDALDLLTAKPALTIANVDQSGNEQAVEALRAFGAERGIGTIALDAKLEAEIAELDEGDRRAFLDDLGIERPALEEVSLAAYAALDLIPFFTSGEKESRAWTIRRGQNAQEAAGKIHTDLARGFIRAEVIEWNKLVEAGGETEAKRRGWLRVEGRDYIVQDGDTLNVRFNV